MKAQIVAASLIGSVAASHAAQHAGFHFRRNANPNVCSTVYTTVYVEAPTYAPMPPAPPASTNTTTAYSEVYVTPSPVPVSSSKAAAPSSYVAPSPPKEVYPSKEAVPSKEVYTPPVVSIPAVSTSVFSAPAYSEPAKSSAAPSSKPSSSYGGNGGRVVTNGDKWAMTYTPYTTGGKCKSQSEVAADVKKIAGLGFTTLRVYSTDCSAFENIAPACKENGLKMIVGVFLDKDGKGPYSEYANQQVQDIKNKAPKDLLVMVIVGNEAVYNQIATAEELGGYVDYVRKELRGAGFPTDIAVTTTEPVDVWQKNASLCSHIDVFTVQVHPFFTAKVSPSGAGDFAKEQLEMAAAVCPEAAKKGAYISEIGWPHGGDSNGNAVPGPAEQKEAIKSILEKVGSKACLFSFQDDAWKAPGSFNVEQKFGCSSALN